MCSHGEFLPSKSLQLCSGGSRSSTFLQSSSLMVGLLISLLALYSRRKSCHRSHFSCSLQSLFSSAVVGAAALPLQHLTSHALAGGSLLALYMRKSCHRLTESFQFCSGQSCGTLLQYLKSQQSLAGGVTPCPLHEEVLPSTSLQLFITESFQFCSGQSCGTLLQYLKSQHALAGGVTPCPLHEEVLPSKSLQLCSGGSSSSTFLAAASLSLHYLKSHALVGGCHFLMSSTQGTLAVRVSQLCSVGSKSCTFLAILNSHALFTFT